MSSPTIYLVAYEPSTRQWVVKNGDPLTKVAGYRDKDRAMIAAQRAARANEPSRLVVHRQDGAIELEWNYGKKPYLPTRTSTAATPPDVRVVERSFMLATAE